MLSEGNGLILYFVLLCVLLAIAIVIWAVSFRRAGKKRFASTNFQNSEARQTPAGERRAAMQQEENAESQANARRNNQSAARNASIPPQDGRTNTRQ